MPYKIKKSGKRYAVYSPQGVRAKHTTLKKAKAQIRLLKMIEPKHNK